MPVTQRKPDSQRSISNAVPQSRPNKSSPLPRPVSARGRSRTHPEFPTTFPSFLECRIAFRRCSVFRTWGSGIAGSSRIDDRGNSTTSSRNFHFQNRTALFCSGRRVCEQSRNPRHGDESSSVVPAPVILDFRGEEYAPFTGTLITSLEATIRRRDSREK